MENMELKNKKIIFCFPYRGAGGVPLLFLRLGSYIKKLGYDVSILDYSDGFMSLNNKDNLELIEYKDDKIIELAENSILILQSMTPWSIYSSLKINGNTSLFFITTIPTNFYPALPIFRDKILNGGILSKIVWNTVLIDEYNKIKKFIKLGLEKKSIVFLDDDIVCNLKHNLKVNIENPKILPLFSDNIDENLYLKKRRDNFSELTVGWVGRIADFKVYILNRVIEDLKNYSDEQKLKIKFIIVGEGDRESSLLYYHTDNFIIERIQHIEPSMLEEQLLKFELYFAMGTSALDGARLGVPTVRLDYSFNKINKDYRYKFLFDTLGYSLGENIDSSCYKKGLHSMANIINIFSKDIVDISNKTYEFYQFKHSLENSALKFINFLETSNIKWSDMINKNILSSKLYDFWKKIR